MSDFSKNAGAPVFLIDAYGLIYRFYFAFMSRPLRNQKGQNVSSLFGFARTIVSLLQEGAPAAGPDGEALPAPLKPECLAAVFDHHGPTFRHKLYPEYKANREKAPEDLHAQVPLVEEILEALRIPRFKVAGYEADDIIAAIARRCRREGRQCYIISSDKDLLQLVGDGVFQLRPQKNPAPGAGLSYELVNSAAVKAAWGVGPEGILDLLSLTGDSSDNVPGVKGIGEKTAVRLMARYGSLDEIYKNLAGIEGSTGTKLAAGREDAYFSRKLIQLHDDVPLPISSLDELSIAGLDAEVGALVLLREGLRQSALALDPESEAKFAAIRSDAPPQPRHRAAPHSPSGQPGDAAPSAGLFEPAPPELLGQGNYRTILNIEELDALLSLAHSKGFITLDFETDSLDAWKARPVGISLALKPREAYYVPVAPHEGTAPFLPPEQVRPLLEPLLADPSMTVAAHNAKYDYQVARRWGTGRWQCRIWDTMVAAWLLDPNRASYSLDSLAGEYLKYSPVAFDDVVPKGKTFDAVPLDAACRYSAEDADLTARMKAYLEARLQKAEALFSNLEMPLLPILAEMETEGIMIESATLQEYGRELAGELEKLQADTFQLVGHEFNLGSPKQLQEVLFVERGLKPGRKTKTGYSTDVDVLEELAAADPVPALLLRHRTLAKLKSTYIDTLTGLADEAGRVHTHFIQTGTATGRLSSRDPNLQNIPVREESGRRIRNAFVSAPGRLFISADYSQIELVVLAHLSGDPSLCDAFRSGRDVHARTAALIFGIDEGEVRPEQRRIAKTINFGVMYGMSAFRLAGELGTSRHEAAAFIEAYFKTYSGVKSYIDSLIAETERTGYASTLFGRRRYIPYINSRNKTEKTAADRVAVNTPIQGTAADIVKTAMIAVDRALRERGSPAKMLLQVHDELILECPEGETEAAAALVKAEMEKAVTLSVPLRVSVETGRSWGDFH
jgi:DNA polymerase-1